jgi:PAS domain S-box-containing protein
MGLDGRKMGFIGISIDITERKQAEQALRDSEEKYRFLIENMTDVVWQIAPDLRFTYVSPTDELQRGYKAEEVLGKSVFDFMTPESKDRVSQLSSTRQARMQKGEILESTVYEIEQICKDGHLIWTEVSSNPAYDAAGRLTHFQGVTRDITERKHTEAALRENESKYRALYQEASIGIFHSTFAGRFIDVNPALARMLGYASPQEVVDSIQSIAEQVYAVPPRRDEIISQMLAEGKTVTAENRYRRANGEEWDAYLHLRYILDPQGKPLYLEGFVEDITERKRAEAALRESEAKFRAIIDLSPVPYALNDDEQNIIYLNAAFTKIFGYTLEEVPTLAEWWPRAYPDLEYRGWVAETWQARLDQAKAQGTEFEPLEVNLRGKDGSVKTALVTAGALTEAFKDVHLVIFYDITERKRAEAQLNEQLNELRRWHAATLGREMRILALKREVNELLEEANQPPRYPSASESAHEEANRSQHEL